jgi:hypothetical protein
MSRDPIKVFTDYAWGLSSAAGVDGQERFVFIEEGVEAPSLELRGAMAADGAVVFAPERPEGVDEELFVEALGSLGTPGEELVVGNEIAVETFSFAESAFVSTDGPAYVAITDGKDGAALHAACEEFVAGGVLPEALTRRNLVFEAGGLIGSCSCHGGTRLTARAGGGYSTGIVGLETKAPPELPIEGSRGTCAWCAPAVEGDGRIEQLVAGAAMVVRRLGEMPRRVSVSGAGTYLDQRVGEIASLNTPNSGIILVRADGQLLGLGSTSMSVYRISEDAGRILEWYTWCGVGEAISQIGDSFALEACEAEAALRQVLAGVGVRLDLGIAVEEPV